MTETKVFEQAYLPDMVKEDLCRALLAEFGVTSISTREPDGELIHCCVMPWHPERKPSASLNYKKLTYRCLGCGSKGGLLWLIATVRHQSSTEARQWLDGETGLGSTDFDLGALLHLLDAIEKDRPKAATPIPEFSPRVLDPWRFVHPWLTTGAPDLGIPGRGIPEQTVIDMQVGYAAEYPMGKDESGALVTSERIVIPHFWRGKLVGWQTRRLNADDGSPKYKSSADFPKDRTIYDHDPKRRKAVVVESPSSVLRHRHHLPMAGTFGSVVTDPQVRLLAEYEDIVLWPDPDPAGWRSVLGWTDEQGVFNPGLVQRLEPYSRVRIVDSPWAADPADMDDPTAEEMVESAVPFAAWSVPSKLLCWTCKTSHEGKCPDGR